MTSSEIALRQDIIINRIKKSPCTFKQLSEHLIQKSRDHDVDYVISKKTFRREQEKILSLFNIEIKYDSSRKVYYVNDNDDLEVNVRMIEAYQTFNALRQYDNLSDNIHFEKRKPKGTENLNDILKAIDKNLIINFNYNSFWKSNGYDNISDRKAEPYALKEFKNRWYVIAKDLKDNTVKSFALDRFRDLSITKTVFKTPLDFNVNTHFKHSFGIVSPNNNPLEEIELSFNVEQGKYIKTLPLHESQQILIDNDKELRIRLKLYVTFDFKMEILSFGKNVKVLKPISLVNDFKLILTTALNQY